MEMLSAHIQGLLSEQINDSRLRELRPIQSNGPTTLTINGNQFINFASNDYLGLSQHPLLKERAIKAIEKYGVGCPSSRLISGNCELYETIESQIAKLKGTEEALILSTGFQTNLTAMIALSKLKTRFLCDKLSHNSILLGIQTNKKQFSRFLHNDIQDLRRLLEVNNDSQNKLIVTESVFSMGDLAPLEEITELSDEYSAHLYVDEAHATGIFGGNGMGLVHGPSHRTITMGTFGKGCGSFGAYIACSKQFRDFFINFCPGLIYTTALPPSILASIQAALELIPRMTLERKQLLKRASLLRNKLNEMGFDTGESQSQIICIYAGNNKSALSLSQHLEQNNIYAPCIRPPTVPENTARIRLSLSVAHNDSDIEYLLKILRGWHAKKQ